MKTKWNICQHTWGNFLHKHSPWYQTFLISQKCTERGENTHRWELEKVGGKYILKRQVTRLKILKVADLLANSTHEELVFASEINAADIVKEVSNFSPKKGYTTKKGVCFCYQILSLVLKQAKAQSADIYPLYNSTVEAKKACYPEEHTIVIITEMSAEVNVQASLDHTLMRLALGYEGRWNSLHLGINTSPNMNMIINGAVMVHQAKIKFFECRFQISFRLEFLSWKVTKANKAAFDVRKKYIQQQF
ncbi:hypothetical protein PR048_019944 [Dryococelus australis]|uniref:Uncharacterized protein n=1 Tax=Dryococelus australis TaxID=614101 RepID=A0ABQ9H541_9NEOP|nr:hypothetical protein PR048_019944 [Dryococelus australis]